MEPNEKKQLRQLSIRLMKFLLSLVASVLFLVACVRESGTHKYALYKEGIASTAFGAAASLLSLIGTLVNTFRMPCSRFCPLAYLNAGIDIFAVILLLASGAFNAMFAARNNVGGLKMRRITCSKNEVAIGFKSMEDCIGYESQLAGMEIAGTILMFACSILHAVAFVCSCKRIRKMRRLRSATLDGKSPESDVTRVNSDIDYTKDKLSTRTNSV